MDERISSPPNLHSPLSLVKIDETLIFPWTEEPSSLINFRVLLYTSMPTSIRHKDDAHSYRIKPPFNSLCAQALTPDMPPKWRYPLSGDINIGFGLCLTWANFILFPSLLSFTSTVSRTFTIPGCLKVLSFLTAFFAKGNFDLFAVTSKLKMLQLEPSSWYANKLAEIQSSCPQ